MDLGYDQILRELVLAMGAALFLANAFALVRRRADARALAPRTVARNRPGSPVRGFRRDGEARDLPQAPVARSVTYMVVGLLVMVWALATLLSG